MCTPLMSMFRNNDCLTVLRVGGSGGIPLWLQEALAFDAATPVDSPNPEVIRALRLTECVLSVLIRLPNEILCLHLPQ